MQECNDAYLEINYAIQMVHATGFSWKYQLEHM